MDVVGVPVQVCDGTVVLPGVEHDQVEERSNRVAAPDTKVVIHLDLTDGHPPERVSKVSFLLDCTTRHLLEVGTHSIHLALINRNTAILHKGTFGVVQLRSSIAVSVVGNLDEKSVSRFFTIRRWSRLTSWSSQTGIHGKVAWLNCKSRSLR